MSYKYSEAQRGCIVWLQLLISSCHVQDHYMHNFHFDDQYNTYHSISRAMAPEGQHSIGTGLNGKNPPFSNYTILKGRIRLLWQSIKCCWIPQDVWCWHKSRAVRVDGSLEKVLRKCQMSGIEKSQERFESDAQDANELISGGWLIGSSFLTKVQNVVLLKGQPLVLSYAIESLLRLKT